jgi:DNA-binding transcriptional MocR family regulator
MHRTITQLRALGLVPWVEPQAGMFLWCKLPGRFDAADLAQQALAEDIVLAPGNAFSLSQSARSYLRFNVAQSSDPRIGRFLRKALVKRI